MSKPSSTARFLIGISSIGLLVCVVCCCVFGFYLRSFQQDMEHSGEGLREEALSFASNHDQSACVDDALRRTDACGADLNIMCHAYAGVFLTECLGGASPVAGFCDGVPVTSDVMDSVAWSMRVCAARGRPSEQPCTRLMQSIQRHCHP